MAMADYRLCDVCGGKAFYDSNLNYEFGGKVGDKFVYPENPAKYNGQEQKFGHALDYLGDWSVLCLECSKTHECTIRPIDATIDSAKGG